MAEPIAKLKIASHAPENCPEQHIELCSIFSIPISPIRAQNGRFFKISRKHVKIYCAPNVFKIGKNVYGAYGNFLRQKFWRRNFFEKTARKIFFAVSRNLPHWHPFFSTPIDSGSNFDPRPVLKMAENFFEKTGYFLAAILCFAWMERDSNTMHEKLSRFWIFQNNEF